MLNSMFDMKDIGLDYVILETKIVEASYGLILSQTYYVDKHLEKFSENESSIARTSLDMNLH